MKEVYKENVNKADKIIGKRNIPYGMKDSDGDGVENVLDCQPYNKNEQGMIHRLSARVASKVGAKKTAERIEERGKFMDELREERIKKRRELAKKRALYKEKEKDKYERKRIATNYSNKKPVIKRTSGFFEGLTTSKGGGSPNVFNNIFGDNNKGKKKEYKMPKIF